MSSGIPKLGQSPVLISSRIIFETLFFSMFHDKLQEVWPTKPDFWVPDPCGSRAKRWKSTKGYNWERRKRQGAAMRKGWHLQKGTQLTNTGKLKQWSLLYIYIYIFKLYIYILHTHTHTYIYIHYVLIFIHYNAYIYIYIIIRIYTLYILFLRRGVQLADQNGGNREINTSYPGGSSIPTS